VNQIDAASVCRPKQFNDFPFSKVRPIRCWRAGALLICFNFFSAVASSGLSKSVLPGYGDRASATLRMWLRTRR
jgi:hypothetical protein